MDHHIDCSTIDSRREFHRVLAKELAFPDWYGNNLDALHDCLTAISEDTGLVFSNWPHDASFSRSFLRVLTDSTRENPHLTVTFQ